MKYRQKPRPVAAQTKRGRGPSATPPQISPFVRICGEYQLPTGYTRRPWWNYDWEFIHVLSGSAQYRVGWRTYTLAPGDLLLIPPHVFTRSWNPTSMPMRFQAVHFDFFYSPRYARLPPHGTGRPHPAAHPTASLALTLNLPQKVKMAGERRLKSIFDRIIREVMCQAPGYGLLAQAGLLELLAILLRAAAPLPQSTPEPPSSIQDTLRFLVQAYARPLRLSDLAKASGLSPAHFERRFKLALNCSPMAYLMRLRLQKAAELMRQAPRPVKEIASAVGFEDPYYFSKAFHRHTGMTPTQYQEQAEVEGTAEPLSLKHAVAVPVMDVPYFGLRAKRS